VAYDRSVVDLLATEIAGALTPLTAALEDGDTLRAFLSELGWEVPDDVDDLGLDGAAIDEVIAAVTAVRAAEAGDGDAAAAYTRLIAALAVLVTKVYELRDGIGDHVDAAVLAATGMAEELPRRVVDYLVVEHVTQDYPHLAYALTALGIFELTEHEEDAATYTSEHTRRVVHYDRVATAVTAPGDLIEEVYGWGTPSADLTLLLSRLSYAMIALGLPARLSFPAYAKDSNLSAPATLPAEGERDRPELRVPIVWSPRSDAALGLTVMQIPATTGTGAPGLAVAPYISGAVSTGTPLGRRKRWFLGLDGSLDLTLNVGVIVRPGEDLRVATDLLGAGGSGTGAFEVSLTRQAADGETLRLLTLPGGGAVIASALFAKLGLQVGTSVPDEVYGEVGVDEGVVQLAFGESDSFLQSVLPADTLELAFDMALGWSSARGVYFKGSAGLEATFPLHVTIGPIALETLHVSVMPADGVIPVVLAVSGNTTLGPLAVSVAEVGVELDLKFPESGGNLGPVQLDVAFKPPSGLGIVVDAGPVTGGGFLYFDPPNGRYAGVLDLKIYEIGVTAIGLLDTILPDGEQGFSFLLIISATFPPIQLGYGFTLNGVGGLAGIHRTIVTEALQSGLRSGSVDHILFPEDPVRDAPQIISDLRTIFPPCSGRYLFGPVAMLGWGTPTLIQAEIGLIIELPDPILLVLLGQLSMVLPTEDAAVVRIHLDVLGILDFEAKTLSIDATLRDSSIASFALTGDMAMRLAWGDEPNFALSVGGLHPSFDPPAGFPTLARVGISIGAGDNPRLTLQGYFALTSNSLQLGASAELYAEAAGFNVYGWLGFDALIIFSPFAFRASLGATVAFRRGDTKLAAVQLEATLTGPTPYHVWGKASASVLMVEVSVPFDATFGRSSSYELPAADPWPALEEAISDTRNWSGRLPSSVVNGVTFVDGSDAGAALINPAGVVEVRQKVVPLDMTFTKFGEQVPDGVDRFGLAGVRLGDADVESWSAATDYFAPGQYEELSDSEKLSRAAFEKMTAGACVDSTAIEAGLARVAAVEYETRIIDSPWDGRIAALYSPLRSRMLALAGVGASALCGVKTSGARKYAPAAGAVAAFDLGDEEFVIATTDTLAVRGDVTTATTHGGVSRALAAYLAAHPEEAGRLQVMARYETEAAA
jgi:hypothetical protein